MVTKTTEESSAPPPAIARWHAIASTGNVAGLDALLAEDVVFQSPVVHTPQVGKARARAYLEAALLVLGNHTFRYVGEWFGARSAVLEFTLTLDEIAINGVDIIGWDAADRISSFKVMVRPVKAINLLHQRMAAMLASKARTA